MLRNLKLKAVYRSDEDNILEDFYLPALSVANSYDRAVGYFSAAMLSYAAQGLSAFVRNDGKMRLIIGGELQAEDEKAIREGYDLRDVIERLGLKIVDTMESVGDALFYRRLEALSWLVASGRLDIKVALRTKGMYHEKIGIIRDAEGDAVVFQGSANETANALLPDFNFESINVFPCWREDLSAHFTPYVRGFAKLWANESQRTTVVDFPDAAKRKLIRVAQSCRILRPDIELQLAQERLHGAAVQDNGSMSLQPHLPKVLNGQEFRMGEHQLKALNAWKANAFRGILAHATGSGKTITAIYGAVRLLEAMHSLVLGIAVPYQNLADQWVNALSQFNISAIRCYGSREAWHSRFSEICSLYSAGATRFACFVVVNRTLQSSEFQTILKEIPGDSLMWVGDECHHHTTPHIAAALPQHARVRLGLSATPEHYMDLDATRRLIEYYGEVVSEFSLAQALEAGVITPYRYFICPVDLNESEASDYREISDKISQHAGRCKASGIESVSDEQMKVLLAQRARLLGCARGKITALEGLLKNGHPHPLTLFYCGDGSTEDEDTGDLQRHVDQVTTCLYNHGWKCAQFTARESREEREGLLDSFRLGIIDALVAIRCLDEGIDVPACRTAYLLASGRNPKQFIQRRGRILRKSEGKEYATIYDFLVKFPEDRFAADGYERQLVKAELERVAEFTRLARNSADAIRTLMPILKSYDLAHLLA